MLPEIAQFSLIIALLFAVMQSTIPLLGVWQNQIYWQSLSRPLAYAQCCFIGWAFFILGYSFLMNDFSITYVWQNSNSHLPWPYRFAAIWGAHEGSMLLWITILSLWMAAVAKFSKTIPQNFIAQVLAVMGMINFGFLLFILLTSNPFARLLANIPTDGQDLNPLLQDPGLISHPPMLYMGYVGFSVAFAFSIAALISGRLNQEWARWARPWTITAWCFLTLGITLGSWWSYRVLGWGGWWFWDPVENASFMPWLAGTALLHSLIVTEKRNAFKSWTILLAILTFSLSLIGTFLVRSGILNSVHAFAADPTRGAFILKFLILVIGTSLLLYAWRASTLKATISYQLLSKESFLFFNNLFLMVATATVLLGTLYPLILEALGLGKISVGTPYFNTVFIPISLPFLFLMGFAPAMQWREMSWQDLLRTLKPFISITIITLILVAIWFSVSINRIAMLGLALALWIILNTFYHLFQRWRFAKHNKKFIPLNTVAMTVAHFGLAVVVIGISLSTQYSQEVDLRMAPGDVTRLGNYTIAFKHEDSLVGSNYTGMVAEFEVRKNHQLIALLHPEKRLFTQEQVATSIAAINATLFRDLYVVLGEPIGQNAWAVRIYNKPFVRWIWFGGLFMILGGMLTLFSHRKSQQLH